MFIPKTMRLKEFLTKSLKEEYDKTTDNINYKTKNYIESPRNIDIKLPFSKIYVEKHKLNPYTRYQENRPYNDNNISKPLNMYDVDTGIYASKVSFMRGVYRMDEFIPKPTVKSNF